MSSNNNKFTIGEDGVAQIYPDKKDGTQVYMKDNPDKNTFNVSYGTKSHLPYQKKTEGKLTFFNTTGNPINYNSGSKSGRSTRIDTYPDGGMWKNKSKFYWKKNPGYLYTDKGILNGEFTTFIRVHDDLGTHQAYAHKIGGRDEDALRSLAEMVYPTSSHSNITFNYNFAHFPYVSAKAKQLQKVDTIQEDQWIGVKTIHIVNTDHTQWEMWVDINPFTKEGSIQNNWVKVAEYRDEGCSQYGDQPVNWRCHKDVCRVDGFGNVDFALFSDREIDPSALPVKQGSEVVVDGNKGDSTQSKPVVNDDEFNWNSVEEVQEAEDFIKAHPDIALLQVLGKDTAEEKR